MRKNIFDGKYVMLATVCNIITFLFLSMYFFYSLADRKEYYHQTNKQYEVSSPLKEYK